MIQSKPLSVNTIVSVSLSEKANLNELLTFLNEKRYLNSN